tara:strand:- start:15826 stop:16491 length:666 start_codon:yes stop_codon:yes gene_type:complete
MGIKAGYENKGRAGFSRDKSASFSGGNQGGGRGQGIGGTPVGPGRGPIRNAMQNDTYHHTLKDRMAARRADKKMGQQAAPAPAGGAAPAAPKIHTQAATGSLLKRRQGLKAEMEAAGSGGITPALRQKARGLGVADESFNRVAGNIRNNELYTPGKDKVIPAKKKAAPRRQSSIIQVGVKSDGKSSSSEYYKRKAARRKANDEARSEGLNPLTGQPIGFKP